MEGTACTAQSGTCQFTSVHGHHHTILPGKQLHLGYRAWLFAFLKLQVLIHKQNIYNSIHNW